MYKTCRSEACPRRRCISRHHR